MSTRYDLARFGPMLENHPIFPERANISLAHVTAPDAITLRTWERGVGLTRACGTAACAALVCRRAHAPHRPRGDRHAAGREAAHRMGRPRPHLDDRPGRAGVRGDVRSGDRAPSAEARMKRSAIRVRPSCAPDFADAASGLRVSRRDPRDPHLRLPAEHLRIRGDARRAPTRPGSPTRSSSTPAPSPPKPCARRGRRSAGRGANTRQRASSSPAAPRRPSPRPSRRCRRSISSSATRRSSRADSLSRVLPRLRACRRTEKVPRRRHLLRARHRFASGRRVRDRARAFVQVQNGCDHRCTFCIIPFGRGQLALRADGRGRRRGAPARRERLSRDRADRRRHHRLGRRPSRPRRASARWSAKS